MEKPGAEAANLTLRERFAQHRSNASCAACHRSIDPLGFALENFNAAGLWRERYENGRDVDVSGTLLGRHEFRTVVEFKDALLTEKDRFTRAFASHLLSFGLGREMGVVDTVALDEIVERTADADYRFHALIEAVVTSRSFLQTTPAKPSLPAGAKSGDTPMNSTTTRRAFLRGAAGVTLSLPWLESLADTGTPPKPARRMAFFYVPIGVVRRGFFTGEADAALPKFTSNQKEIARKREIPVGLHEFDELTPTLQPLERLKDKVTFITGMDRFYKHGSDVHAQCGSCFLSSATAHSVRESVYPLARTLDHVVADHVGGDTPFRTLELSCNSHRDNKESIYFDNISWFGTNHVAPSIRDPRKVYRRLFGTRDDRGRRDVTDLVLADARDLRRRLGSDDREKFEEYFDGIRALEERMDKLDRMQAELARVVVDEPPAAHLPRGEYIRLMGDLMITALRTGLTNVATLMVGPERWDTPFTYETLFDKPMSHHQMSHNQDRFIEQLLEVDRFHMQQYAYLVQKMSTIRESDGSTLLDNTLFTYGSGLGDGATHQYTDLPIIVAGTGGGRFRTGHHLHCSEGTPLANLWLTQARLMGADLKRFADSTEAVERLLF